MFHKILKSCMALLIPVSIVVMLIPGGFATAQNGTITVVATYQEDEVVTLNVAGGEIITFDPQVAGDSGSINVVSNLFHGLTDTDPVTTEIVPALATSWTVSEDGITWTFHLRDDVMWYRYNPASGTADALRLVVAQDFVYGIQRGCDPRLGSGYSAVVAPIIAGCNIVYNTPLPDVTNDLVFGNTTHVSALDDTTLVIELNFAAGFFLSMSRLWTLYAVHRETIEQFGDAWTEPGNIATNGPFFLEEDIDGVRRVMVRNKNHSPDLDYGDNIERIVWTTIEDEATVFVLYQDHQLDVSGIPLAERQNVLNDPAYQDQLIPIYGPTVFYFGFAHDKAPFDNIHVRRAFAAIVDRNAFVAEVLDGLGVPMIHFTPPGIFGAPPVNEVGAGFDPDYAAAELAAAGYPDCQGLPAISFITFNGAGDWATFWAAAAEEYLGCSADLFTVQQLEFPALIEAINGETGSEDRPHAWTLGWGADYPDAHNFVHDAGLACDAARNLLRPCSDVDMLIDQAARETDPAVRQQLYLEIETAFFGPDGEHPIVPLFMPSGVALRKSWYTGPHTTDGLFFAPHWDAYNIDMAAKLAARGE